MNLKVNTGGARCDIVTTILATWSELAELIIQEAEPNMSTRCNLEWESKFVRVHEHWEARCAVRMVFEARVDGVLVNVPYTEVGDIKINDGGLFSWHSEFGKPRDNPGTVTSIVTAVTKGELSGGRHYRCNWIPFPSGKE